MEAYNPTLKDLYGNLYLPVIASEAKQSKNLAVQRFSGLLRFARNDDLKVFEVAL